MPRKRNLAIILGAFLLFIVIAVSVIKTLTDETPQNSSSSPQDLSKHPVYIKYLFGRSTEDIIDFGIQPLGMPIGVISEVIRNDRVLRN